MDLYRLTPGDLSTDQLRAALLAADEVLILLLDVATNADALPESRGSRSAYRLEVHAAAGMVKVQLATSIEHALVRDYAPSRSPRTGR
jgi:hypothetical protein